MDAGVRDCGGCVGGVSAGDPQTSQITGLTTILWMISHAGNNVRNLCRFTFRLPRSFQKCRDEKNQTKQQEWPAHCQRAG